jgi:hypothetical protein
MWLLLVCDMKQFKLFEHKGEERKWKGMGVGLTNKRFRK